MKNRNNIKSIIDSDDNKLLNELAILGLPSKTTAYVHTVEGSFPVEIDIIGTELSSLENDRMSEDFNEEIKVVAFKVGVTYSFKNGTKFIKSSSLEEIWEMFKAARTGQIIPERKCNIWNYFKKPSTHSIAI